jgi:monofunctional glycosyltransferase
VAQVDETPHVSEPAQAGARTEDEVGRAPPKGREGAAEAAKAMLLLPAPAPELHEPVTAPAAPGEPGAGGRPAGQNEADTPAPRGAAATPIRAYLPASVPQVVAAASAREPPPGPLPDWLARALPTREEMRGLLAQAPLTLPHLRRGLALAMRWAGMATVGVAAAVLALVLLYRWVNPPFSALMLSQSLAGTAIEREWVPLERVSPNLIKAVVLSEDGGFCRHHGVDWGALHQAIESDRGGSTITMQVVKNLFLWPSRSYVRKAIEIGLAYLVEAVWPKQRILEIYLNIAEWGDGIFGIETAAQAHFDKHASRLTGEEAALLAVALPNPIERSAGAPSLVASRLAGRLLMRMATSRADLTCLPAAARVAPRKAPLVHGPRMTL